MIYQSLLSGMVNITSISVKRHSNKDIEIPHPAKSEKQPITNHTFTMANEIRGLNSIAASGTGDSALSDVSGRTKEYRQLIDYGLDAKVANRLDEIFKTGKHLGDFL